MRRIPAMGAASIARQIRAGAGALTEFLLPIVCAACNEPVDAGEQGIVCGRCWARLAWLPAPQCSRCGHPMRGSLCHWCDLLPPYIRAVRSVCWATSGSGQQIVHALKYAGWHAVASGMAARMARLSWPQDVLEERVALVPVPLAASRQRERGYNQSERVASALAGWWSIPVWSGVLVRVRQTRTQTRLRPDERARNVAEAFAVPAAARHLLRGAHVVLVDDVVTTASTLIACADTLCAAGTRIVSGVTFGRAPAVGDRQPGERHA